MGKNAATEAMTMAAALPAPNQRTKSGKKDKSGRAPKSMTSGVKVKSTLFLLPAANAMGNATEKASTRPQDRLTKLCKMRSRKAGSWTDEASESRTLEKAGRFDW